MATLSALLGSFMNRKRLTATREEYRVLTPISSALEVHSYKSAIQLCNKQLKKQPDDYSILKLVALSRATKPLSALVLNEIMSIVEFIKTNANGAGLGDPDVLMFLGWVLSGMGKGDEVLTIFAKATSKHGENEDVCVEAFLHYVRVRERKLAQQLSMRMQRIFPKKENYLWWSLSSILLHVREANNPSSDLLLSLAERQITAHYAALRSSKDVDSISKLQLENGTTNSKEVESSNGSGSTTPIEFENTHEFHLVTRFLELSTNNAESKAASHSQSTKLVPSPNSTTSLVLPSLPPSTSDIPLTLKETLLAHFNSKEADKWCEKGLGNEIWRRETELRFGSVGGGEWMRSWERMKRSLENGDTNWHTMLYLIRTAFSYATGSSESYLAKKNDQTTFPATPSEKGAELLKETRVLFRKLADDGQKGKKERGFLLALLEVARESRIRRWEEVDPFVGLVEEYFERFSTKMLAFDDLYPYLELLTTEEKVKLVEKMSVITSTTGELTLNRLQRDINATKVARFLSPSVGEEAEVKLAHQYLEKYFEALPLGKDLIATDLQPADDFAYLAGQAFVSAWEVSKQRTHLESALAVLEYAATRSKYKYQIRILAISISRILGAPSLALNHHRQLSLKAIQFDTLSHVVLDRASTFSIASGNEQGLVEESEIVSRWYRIGEAEAAEMPVRAFTFQNYTKIEDFVVFQDRLHHSLNKHALLVESIRMKVLAGTLDQAALEDATATLALMATNVKTTLSDNRDFQTMPNLQAHGSPTIWDQVQMGPRLTQTGLRALACVYCRLLAPTAPAFDLEADKFSDLTKSEIALLGFSKATQTALNSGLDDSDSEQAALAFFKSQTVKFSELIEDSSSLPWELLHTAEITLEGYCLLDLAVDRKIADLTHSKVQDHAKISKKLRTLRTAGRELVKSLGAKVNAHAKQVAKQRTKTKDGLVALKAFSSLDDDYLLAFSHGLVESRKSMAEGLAAAIHRKCSK